jgi:glycosyltransferase involved in cell wall biosynthesis
VLGTEREGLSARRQAEIVTTALWSRRAADAMRSLIHSFRPDVVHSHKLYPQLSASPLAVARRHGVPVVQTAHDYEFTSASPLEHRRGWVDRDETSRSARALNSVLFLEKRSIHRASVTRWIAVSRYVQARLAAGGIRSTVLPNFVPAGDSVPAWSDRDGLVFVGKLSEEKGIDHVLRLAERMPGVRIRIAGDGIERERVIRAARATPTIEYLGRLSPDEVRPVLGRARVALVPSLWQEPGALSVLEAMAAGTPVIAYDVGGIAEYVGDSGAGVVIPPSVDGLESACRELLGGGSTWENMAQAAARAVSTVHSPATYCTRLEDIYEDAIESSRTRRRLSGS